jgi:hypothetical protein
MKYIEPITPTCHRWFVYVGDRWNPHWRSWWRVEVGQAVYTVGKVPVRDSDSGAGHAVLFPHTKCRSFGNEYAVSFVHFAHLLLHHTFHVCNTFSVGSRACRASAKQVVLFASRLPASFSAFANSQSLLLYLFYILSGSLKLLITRNTLLYLSASVSETSKFIDQQIFNAIT